MFGRIRDFFLVSRINVAEYIDAWEQLSPSLFLNMVVIVVARRFSGLFNGVIYAVLKESAFDKFSNVTAGFESIVLSPMFS